MKTGEATCRRLGGWPSSRRASASSKMTGLCFRSFVITSSFGKADKNEAILQFNLPISARRVASRRVILNARASGERIDPQELVPVSPSVLPQRSHVQRRPRRSASAPRRPRWSAGIFCSRRCATPRRRRCRRGSSGAGRLGGCRCCRPAAPRCGGCRR